MIYKDGHKINRINIDGKEIYKVYFNNKVVFKKYRPIEAIVATTTEQYINSEMIDFWTDEIDFEIKCSINLNSSCIFGCRPDKSYQEYGIIAGNDGKLYMRKGGYTVRSGNPQWYEKAILSKYITQVNLLGCNKGDATADRRVYEMSDIYILKKENGKLFYNGEEGSYVGKTSTNDFYLTYLNPFFFRLNQIDYDGDSPDQPNSPNDNGVRYLYYAKFYKKGKLYRNFIPVLDEKDQPALYETVTHKFFYSCGSKPLEYFNGNYGQLSCLTNLSQTSFLNINQNISDLGKIELRLQASALTSPNSTKILSVDGWGAMRNDNTGIYFTIEDNVYIFHIGEQIITTDIPYSVDSEIKIIIDLVNKKLTIEQNHQRYLTNISKRTYNITTSDNFSDLPQFSIGKINGHNATVITNCNARFYQCKIYDKVGKLIQNIKPRINLKTKNGVFYDELNQKLANIENIKIQYI